MKIPTSVQAFVSASHSLPVNDLFENVEPVVTEIYARANNIALYTGKKCKNCGGNKRININSPQWSIKGNHNGECYNCFKALGTVRREARIAFLRKYPLEKAKLAQLEQLKNVISTDLNCECHIHHIIPVSLKGQYSNPELNESSANKIVLTAEEHKQVHNFLREKNGPVESLANLNLDISSRMI